MKLHAPFALLLSAAALMLSGCGYIMAPHVATTVYIECDTCTSGGTTSQIQGFPLTANGVTAAATTITSTLPSFDGLRADASGNLYTTTFSTTTNTYTVVVYAHTASGAAAPVRTFTSPLMAFLSAFAVAPDGTFYFADRANGLLRFAPNASGTATPTQFATLNFVALVTDSSGNLYAAVPSGGVFSGAFGTFAPTEIVVYNAGFTSATPSSVVASLTEGEYKHLVVDASGNIYASGKVLPDLPIILTQEIVVFPASSTTGILAVPTRTITSSALNGGNNLALDSAGNLYVRTGAPGSSPRTIDILKFGPTANGNVTPAATIETGLFSQNSFGIAVY